MVESCRTFEVHHTAGGKEKPMHAGDSHDDDIFGAAISTFIQHDMESIAERSTKQLRASDDEDLLPEIDIGVYRPNTYATTNIVKPATIDELLRYAR